MATKSHSSPKAVVEMFLDVNGEASTKRIIGFIGYISGLVLAFMHYDESLVAIVLTSAVSLILGTAFEKRYEHQPSSHKIKYE